MAHVDNLIERIPDPHLRAQIAEEVAKLVEHKDFGLVFQRHLPEDLEVPGTRPRRGDMVRLRADPEKQNHVVLATKDGRATIIAVDAAKQMIDGIEPSTHDHDELVVVKDFSVPIYPGLASSGEINRGGDKPTHIVIEGENYYALETLLYSHERKVDLIYIDPPYNTGTDDWIYNDRFVSSTDTYRHSKWLSFMERRLLHARRLLTDAGVLIVAIDDHEHHRLRLLLDQVMGEQNFLASVVWRGSGRNDAKFTSGGLDYMVMYARSRDAIVATGASWTETKRGYALARSLAEQAWSESSQSAKIATRIYRERLRAAREQMDPGVYRYNEIDESGRIYFRADLRSPNPRKNLQYDLPHPTTGKPVPMHPNGWVYAPDTMQSKIAEGRILFGADHTTGAYYKRYLDEVSSQAARPTVDVDRRRASLNLATVMGSNEFPFPKDVEVVADWIRIVTLGSPDAVVLDYFAGTGTTSEAVMRLNASDGGRRQSIVVTNNELSARTATRLRGNGHVPGDVEWEREGVFEKVTRRRIETVVTGLRPDGSKYSDGLDENVAFFKLTYEDENLIALGRRFDAVAPLLWMKAGGAGPVVRRRGDALWALPSGAIYGVLFAPAQAKAFAELITVHDRELRHLFVVTDSESEFQEAVAYLPPELRLDTTRLYADYLHSFEINGKG